MARYVASAMLSPARPWHSSRSIQALAWANVGLHVAGMALLFFGIRPGSLAVSLPGRLEYLARAPLAWTAGWAVWMLCALALCAFFATLALRWPSPGGLVALAAVVAIAGCAIDLTCDSIHMLLLPALAAEGAGAVPTFLAFERLALAGGLIVANGAYSVATLLVALALRGHSPAAHAPVVLGVAVAGAGFLLVLAGFMGSVALMTVATGATIGLYCVWVLAVARVVCRAEAA